MDKTKKNHKITKKNYEISKKIHEINFKKHKPIKINIKQIIFLKV